MRNTQLRIGAAHVKPPEHINVEIGDTTYHLHVPEAMRLYDALFVALESAGMVGE